MIYIKDIKTKKEYTVNLSIKKLIFMRRLEPVAYMIYGSSIAVILTIAGISQETCIKILVAAYAINLILDIACKISPVRYIHMLLTRSLITSMFIEPTDLDKYDIYQFFYCYYYTNETKIFKKLLKGAK